MMENDNNLGSVSSPSIPPPKNILILLRFAQAVSSHWAYKLAINIFFTPIKFPTPEREMYFKNNAIVSREMVNDKRITVYHIDKGTKNILMVHGWSGRATQFYKMAPALAKAGFKVYSFTAPAHGSSSDNQTHMLEFADCIEYLDKKYGPFEAIIGHSIGGTAALNAMNQGVETKKLVLMGTPGYLKDVITDFCSRLKLNAKVCEKIIDHIKRMQSDDYEQFSTTRLLEHCRTPGLIVHDAEDKDVNIQQAQKNHEVWKNSTLFETKGLGHRLILSDEEVINEVISFITN